MKKPDTFIRTVISDQKRIDRLNICARFGKKYLDGYGVLLYGNDKTIEPVKPDYACYRFVNTGIKTKAISLFSFDKYRFGDHLCEHLETVDLKVQLLAPIVRIDRYRTLGRKDQRELRCKKLHWVSYGADYMIIKDRPIFSAADEATLQLSSKPHYYGEYGGDWGQLDGQFCRYGECNWLPAEYLKPKSESEIPKDKIIITI